ncbi:hypothetical protein MMC30_002929 [Trapelia coarctata]|nr:hypothetical protein [Trapelia coarctata]
MSFEALSIPLALSTAEGANYTHGAAITDPNTNLTIWETGAIIAYLVDTYDKEEKITYSCFPEKFELIRWAFFQASGQAPFFSQAAWFNIWHHEKLHSAQARYSNELKRVVGVLNNGLKGRNWLVGDKCTYADLAFSSMNNNTECSLKGGPVEWDIKEFPDFEHWMDAMEKRPSVVKVLATLHGTEVSD